MQRISSSPGSPPRAGRCRRRRRTSDCTAVHRHDRRSAPVSDWRRRDHTPLFDDPHRGQERGWSSANGPPDGQPHARDGDHQPLDPVERHRRVGDGDVQRHPDGDDDERDGQRTGEERPVGPDVDQDLFTRTGVGAGGPPNASAQLAGDRSGRTEDRAVGARRRSRRGSGAAGPRRGGRRAGRRRAPAGRPTDSGPTTRARC